MWFRYCKIIGNPKTGTPQLFKLQSSLESEFLWGFSPYVCWYIIGIRSRICIFDLSFWHKKWCYSTVFDNLRYKFRLFMDEITVETRRTSMYWCSNVLDNHGNGLECCGRNLFAFGSKKRQFIGFPNTLPVKSCPTPPPPGWEGVIGW